jgi:hypothetical protein
MPKAGPLEKDFQMPGTEGNNPVTETNLRVTGDSDTIFPLSGPFLPRTVNAIFFRFFIC